MFYGAFDSVTSLLSSGTENKFTINYLKTIYKQLYDNKCVNEENEHQVIEILRTLAEMTVYGDNKSEILFDFFCEKNMLMLFIEILNYDDCPITVQVQILQTLSILIGCVRNDTSLYYLLSNNHVNKIIIFPFDLESDEALRDHYVSFLKSLSMRLNIQTVNFFFIEETSSLPLFSKAIQLLRIDDNMAKIACQTIILNVLKVDDDMCRSYVLQDKILHSLFDEIVNCMVIHYKNIIYKLTEYRTFPFHNNKKSLYHDLSDIFSYIDDWLYYVIDLLGLQIPHLTHNLIAHLFERFINIYIIPSLSSASHQLFFDHISNLIKSIQYSYTQHKTEKTENDNFNNNDNNTDNTSNNNTNTTNSNDNVNNNDNNTDNTSNNNDNINNNNNLNTSTDSTKQLDRNQSTGSLYYSIMAQIAQADQNDNDDEEDEEEEGTGDFQLKTPIVRSTSDHNDIAFGVSITFLTKVRRLSL